MDATHAHGFEADDIGSTDALGVSVGLSFFTR